jgi:hypothetical protein
MSIGHNALSRKIVTSEVNIAVVVPLTFPMLSQPFSNKSNIVTVATQAVLCVCTWLAGKSAFGRIPVMAVINVFVNRNWFDIRWINETAVIHFAACPHTSHRNPVSNRESITVTVFQLAISLINFSLLVLCS